MVINDIEIFVLYSSKAGREVSFFDLARQEDIMDTEDYMPMSFWGTTGGLQIIVDNHNIIFNSTNFHYLVKATSFLIHSMYWIQDKKSDWFNTDDDYQNDITLRTTNDELIRIRKVSVNELILSYTSGNKNYFRKRGDKFFDGVTFNKQAWYDACQQALKEYFSVLLKIVQNNPSDETSKTMMSYCNVWQNIKLSK